MHPELGTPFTLRHPLKRKIFIYTYIYIYVHIHLYKYAYMHFFIYTVLHICKHTHIHIYRYAFIQNLHICIYTFLQLYIYAYLHIYIYTHIHIYIFLNQLEQPGQVCPLMTKRVHGRCEEIFFAKKCNWRLMNISAVSQQKYWTVSHAHTFSGKLRTDDVFLLFFLCQFPLCWYKWSGCI